MSKVVVVGGGAAGMMAAITAAENGHQVTLIEKNEKLGKKIFITGKGRCNLTNNCDVEELLAAVCSNRKFLYSAVYGFTSQDTIDFFESEGMRTKTERGNRVFPLSDHSSDVISTLAAKMRSVGVITMLNTVVKNVLVKDGKACGAALTDGTRIEADAVVVATGGLSYPSTGSTGDGYRMAQEQGHSITELSPSLVPVETEGDWAKKLQGLSLRNVEVIIKDGKKELYREFGEMMFTHFGVTGPLILTASTTIGKKLKNHPLALEINLKPALTEEQLDARILREFEGAKNKQFKNSLSALFPAKLIPVMIERCGILPEKPIHEITKEERRSLLEMTRHFPLTLTRLRDYNEAIITRGGINVREINPATMESKLVTGLYFAGEVLDLDAVTGGFNLQIAWATGRAAGGSIL